MNCERFQAFASDLARDESRASRLGSRVGVVVMEASDRTSALAHVAECAHCEQALSDQRQLSDGLRQVAQEMNLLEAPVHLEEKLRAAFRDRSRVRAIPVAPQPWRYWAGAVAAVLLLAFGVMAWRAHVTKLPQVPLEAKSIDASGSQPASLNPMQVAVDIQTPDRPSPKFSPPPRKLAGNRHLKHGDARQSTLGQTPGLAAHTETKEVTTDFVALGYGSAMDLQDGGQLVRVELPRSALARFGLPMNMDRADERVKADVLVGTDGLARAIRFVK